MVKFCFSCFRRSVVPRVPCVPLVPFACSEKGTSRFQYERGELKSFPQDGQRTASARTISTQCGQTFTFRARLAEIFAAINPNPIANATTVKKPIQTAISVVPNIISDPVTLSENTIRPYRADHACNSGRRPLPAESSQRKTGISSNPTAPPGSPNDKKGRASPRKR